MITQGIVALITRPEFLALFAPKRHHIHVSMIMLATTGDI
jgi:hypothetical protein